MSTRLVVARLRPYAAIGVGIALVTGAVLFATYLPSLNPATPPSAVLAETHKAEPDVVIPEGVQPEVYQGSFFYDNANEMLRVQGITLYDGDIVTAFPDPELRIGSQVKVYRAPVYTIKEGRTSVRVRSWKKTIADLLRERRIDIGERDTVVPMLSTTISGGETITITRVSETDISVTKTIAFTTIYENDPELERGKEQVEQKGVAGSLKITYHIRRENGIEVLRKETAREIVKEPTQEIIKRGTKIVTYGSGKASWYGGVGAMTAAHRTLPKGTMVRVVNVANGKSVVVRIADRGPFIAGRIIDLSKDAFSAIGLLGAGVIDVRVEKE